MKQDFKYHAVHQTSGQTEKGVIQAENVKAVRELLRARGLITLSVNPYRPSLWAFFSTQRRKVHITATDLALHTRQLATLLQAEIPLGQALHALTEQTELPAHRAVWQRIHAQVLEGYALSDALQTYPHLFSRIYIASIRAGEVSGDLSVVLLSLATHLEEQQRLKAKVTQALIYPTVVLIVAIVLTVVLLVGVVPQLLDVFTDTDRPLPAATRALLALSTFFQHAGLPLLVILTIAGIGFGRALKQKPAFAARIDGYLLRIPVIGTLIRQVQTARFLRTLALLLSAGVPLLEAFNGTLPIITFAPLHKALEQALQRIKEGSSLSQALTQTRFFSPLVLHLIQAGERAGQLEALMERAARQQENQWEQALQKGLTLFEPLMIVLMGGIVLFIVLAMLLPIFSATQAF